VIDVVEPLDLRFVIFGALIEARNPFFHRSPEPRTDLEAFPDAALDGHALHLAVGRRLEAEAFFASGLKISRSLPILTKPGIARQITFGPTSVIHCLKTRQ
jgi:hypothetical protein